MADNVEEKKPIKQVACEVYSRIVGYLRPVQDWNKGKQQEFAERKTYTVPPSVSPPDSSSKSG
jgi:anaerobic ribonucleoside-triphosphate reductase